MEKMLITFIFLAMAISALTYLRSRWRRAYLLEKYKDKMIVEKIMANRVWQGMTKEQLLDSWGKPAGRDNRVMKAKFFETYKYNQVGRNRFRSRVMLENDVVIGWQQK